MYLAIYSVSMKFIYLMEIFYGPFQERLVQKKIQMILGEISMEHPLTTLFHTYTELDNPPVLELLNIEHKPVGALYLSDMKYKDFIVSETNNSEKYYLYMNGIGIYFSFYKKLYQ